MAYAWPVLLYAVQYVRAKAKALSESVTFHSLFPPPPDRKEEKPRTTIGVVFGIFF